MYRKTCLGNQQSVQMLAVYDIFCYMSSWSQVEDVDPTASLTFNKLINILLKLKSFNHICKKQIQLQKSLSNWHLKYVKIQVFVFVLKRERRKKIMPRRKLKMWSETWRRTQMFFKHWKAYCTSFLLFNLIVYLNSQKLIFVKL